MLILNILRKYDIEYDRESSFKCSNKSCIRNNNISCSRSLCLYYLTRCNHNLC